VQAAASAIRGGAILALKGLGGFQLLVDAVNEDAVGELRRRKCRDEKPFAVMAPSLDWVRRFCRPSAMETALLASPEAPIVLLYRSAGAAPVAPSVCSGSPAIGLMLPTTPLHHLLLELLAAPVVATSGNRADEPLCIDGDVARDRLSGIADLFLDHNRPIERPVDDSVVRVVAGGPLLLRRARG
jgi:hydrogenase maturation protein HypF